MAIMTKVTASEILNNQKIQREIENLKLETEYKQLQLETLKNMEDSKTSHFIFPRISLPEFAGTRTEWATFWIHLILRYTQIKCLISCLHGEAKDTFT